MSKGWKVAWSVVFREIDVSNHAVIGLQAGEKAIALRITQWFNQRKEEVKKENDPNNLWNHHNLDFEDKLFDSSRKKKSDSNVDALMF